MTAFWLFMQLLLVSIIFSRFAEGFVTKVAEEDENITPRFNLKTFREKQFELHNYYRRKHGVPLMILDKRLSDEAQIYAEELAKNNIGSKHCHNIECNPSRAGENLAHSRGGEKVEVNATMAWYEEIWAYNFCDKSGIGGKRVGHENEETGHFTQVVWIGSVKLGLGYARSHDKQQSYIVARYSPAGNVLGLYNENVRQPNYFLEFFQDNCDNIAGGLSTWSSPSECSRKCGGGVKFQTRTCTNPKPSLNGEDCKGWTKKIASKKWCNTEGCPAGKYNYKQKQCIDLGYQPITFNGNGIYACALFCGSELVGNVKDGTKCNSRKGACLGNKCQKMRKGKLRKREEMCTALGLSNEILIMPGHLECSLICKSKEGRWTIYGAVDDGTPCDSDRKVCKIRKCKPKP